MLFDSLSQNFFESDPSNQLLLLVVPSYIIGLLIYTLGGNWNLGLREGGIFNATGNITPLNLNDGIGLEWWHVLGVVSLVFIIGLSLLLFKIHRMTTNEL